MGITFLFAPGDLLWFFMALGSAALLGWKSLSNSDYILGAEESACEGGAVPEAAA